MLALVVSVVILLFFLTILAVNLLIWRLYGWPDVKVLWRGITAYIIHSLIQLRDFLGVKNFKQSLRKNLKYMPMNYIFLFVLCKLISNVPTGRLITACTIATVVWWLIKSIYSPEPYSGSKYTNLG